MSKFIEERLADCEENVANVAQYSFEEFQKQVEHNRNMGLMIDNMSTRIGYLEEQLATFMEALGKIE